jgi:hypothetical protein
MIVYGGEYDLFCVQAAWHVVWLFVGVGKKTTKSNRSAKLNWSELKKIEP